MITGPSSVDGTEENEQLAASLLRQAQDRQRHRDVVARLTLTRTLLP